MLDSAFRFLTSSTGRWTRIGLGALLAGVGLMRGKAPLAAFGLVTIALSAADLHPPAALFGKPILGRDLRRELGMPAEAPLLRGWSDAVSATRARQGTALH